MNLIIKNIGRIHSGKFKILPITIISGQSLSGKSAVVDSLSEIAHHAKCEYASLKIDPRVEDKYLQQFLSRYANNPECSEITLESDGQQISMLMEHGETIIDYADDSTLTKFGRDLHVIKLPHIPYAHKPGNYPTFFNDHISPKAEMDSNTMYILWNHFGMVPIRKKDSDHIMLRMKNNGLSDLEVGCPFQPSVFNSIRLMEIFKKTSKPSSKKIIAILKNPENGLSSEFVRRYVDVLIEIRNYFFRSGIDFSYVIETTSPVVVNAISSCISGYRYRRTDRRVTISDPKDCIVYGMESIGEYSQVVLEGSFDPNGYLDNWRTRFLS